MPQDSYSPMHISEVLGKEPPYSLEAEQSVLGGILMDKNVVSDVVEAIKPDYFYNDLNREIFTVIYRLFAASVTPDIVAVLDECMTAGVFETKAMARTYLYKVMEATPSSANIKAYCKIIEEKYLIRSLLNAASDIIRMANEGSENAQTMLDSAEQRIYDIRKGKDTQGLTKLESVVMDVYDRLMQITGPEADLHKGAKTGFERLDAITTGLNKTDLIILAARPAMGKSAFALNIAVNACRSTNKQVVIFSLEMSNEQVASRILAAEALVNNSVLRTGKLSQEDWSKLADGTERLVNLPLYMDESAGITVPSMKAKLRRMNNLGLVIIDYLQLMSSPNKHTNRVTEVTEITRQLKLMAKELQVPVIALSQLSRSSEKRDDKRPMLSDLRESGSIEQDADIILFLYRDAYYDKNTDDQSTAQCIVAKNRHGETDTVNLVWRGEYTLFTDPDMIHKEY